MNDKEMLEFAAKAAGYVSNHSWNEMRKNMSPEVLDLVVHNSQGDLISTAWNPLENDGDALRLAESLGMTLRMNGSKTVSVCSDYEQKNLLTVQFVSDRLAATRRAITRAAAEIGRAL